MSPSDPGFPRPPRESAPSPEDQEAEDPLRRQPLGTIPGHERGTESEPLEDPDAVDEDARRLSEQLGDDVE